MCLLPLVFSVALAGAAWGAIPGMDPRNDPINRLPFDNVIDTPQEPASVSSNVTGDYYGFYYQLRDVSGERRDGHSIAGAQWFATTYENYLWNVNRTTGNNAPGGDNETHSIYRRTLGGELPDVPLTTLANLLGTFDYVYVNEPQPYQQWIEDYAANTTNNVLENYYDDYMNPMESVFMALPEGRGDLTVKFMNHYAHHAPYWYIVDDTLDVVSMENITPDGASRDIMEDIQMVVDGYAINVNLSTDRKVLPEHYLTSTVRIQAENTGDYGSTAGYISFRQSAVLSPDASGWRESEHVPVVVANVSDGDASENPLYFAMTIFDSVNATGGDDVVNRVKFRWGADGAQTQDLGNFFMMQPYNNAEGTPTYGLETRVTNRTGTRYRLERYSTGGDTLLSSDNSIDNPINVGYRNIYPDYWAYDLTPDRYGSLPAGFLLDNHSQIAPGLVTVYRNNVDTGYSTIDTNVGSTASYRLYPFSSGTSQNLTLNYTRVAGMIAGSWSSLLSGRTRVRPFTLKDSLFVDRREDEDNTVDELTSLMGMPPVLVTSDALPELTLLAPYIDKDTLNAVEVSVDVPEGLATAVALAADSDDVTSSDTRITKGALLPLVVRFRIPRDEQILSDSDHWTALDTAENGAKLLTAFSKFGSIWVRSDKTRMLDVNLLTALNTRASQRGYDVSNTVRAFTYNDPTYGENLYLEFLVFLADAKSPREGYTGFIDLFKDDGIPYIIIGDGAADGVWDLSFYVKAAGSDPESVTSADAGASSGGGGGCNAGMLGGAAALLAVLALLSRRGKD